MTFKQTENVMSLHQAAYCKRIVENFGILKAKSTPSSIGDNIDILFERVVISKAGQNRTQTFPYRNLLKSLIYLSTHTRPHIAFAMDV